MGLAVGDALGTTLEFQSPGTFTPIEEIVGGGPFGLSAGEWTDDTSMALCLAESLIEKGVFDPADQMERYVRWYREGHLSSNGRCFDIGNTIRSALHRFERTKEPFSGSTDTCIQRKEARVRFDLQESRGTDGFIGEHPVSRHPSTSRVICVRIRATIGPVSLLI